MNSKEFIYYYNNKDTLSKNSLSLCSILLKNIYAIVPLSEKEVDKSFVF